MAIITARSKYVDKLQKGIDDQNKILSFFSQERYVVMQSITILLGLTRKSAFNKMKKLIDLDFIKFKELDYIKHNLRLYYLSNKGIEYCTNIGFNVVPQLQPNKLSLITFEHDKLVQQIRALILQKGYFWEYPTNENFKKIADGYILELEQMIEVELTVKTIKRYQDIISGYIILIRQQPVPIRSVVYIFKNEKAKNYLKYLFSKITTVKIGLKEVKLNDAIFDLFKFYTYDEYIELINNSNLTNRSKNDRPRTMG